MADQHNDDIPALGNAIAEDIADIEENLEYHKDVFQKITTGWSNTSTSGIGFITTIWVPASAMVPTNTNGATPGIAEKATNDTMYAYYAFDDATEEYVSFNVAMPEGWDRSTIKAKFYWSSATGSTAADTVEWEISGVAVSDNDALDVAQGTSQKVSDALLANNGGDLQVTAATAALTIGGTPALGDLVNFKVSRNVSGTDDMAEDAWLFGVLIQITETTSIAAW